MTPVAQQKKWIIILILGALETVTPFSIDMYLAAFPQIAADLHTSPSRVALSVSSYFIGFGICQILYGPLLDRFGRRKPLTVGLILYVLASFACTMSRAVEALIIFRFLQALGGSVASVAAISMVRDFFPLEESAKVYSLLILVLGVSPLFAPTVGGLITTAFGWQSIFILLGVIAVFILIAALTLLPESHVPDPSISLRLGPIMKEFGSIFRDRIFSTYALAGSFSFAGLFIYVAGSPIIFMSIFHVSAINYGGIFALLSVAFIGGSQVNLLISKKVKNEIIFIRALELQSIVSLVFLVAALTNMLTLPVTLILLFLTLACVGIGTPNSTALALAPFEKNIGSASSLIGFLRIGIAALASSGVGLFSSQTLVPSISFLAAFTWIGLLLAKVLPKR